jgi:hypothetical protein
LGNFRVPQINWQDKPCAANLWNSPGFLPNGVYDFVKFYCFNHFNHTQLKKLGKVSCACAP